jgi:hypothetical protein
VWLVEEKGGGNCDRRDIAQRLHETLTGAGAPLLGVVANGLKSGRGGGYGSYGYAYNYATTGSGPTAGVGAPADAGTEGSAPTGASANGAVSSDAPVPTAKA